MGELVVERVRKAEMIAGIFSVCGEAVGTDLWCGGGMVERVRLRALWSVSEV